MGMYDSLLNTAYTSKLGRAGDAAGMNQWTNQIDAWARSGMSGDQINKTVMDAFGNTPEGQAYAQSQAQPQAQPMTLDRIGGGYADTSQGKMGAPTAGQMTGGYADPNAAPTAGKLGMAQGGTAPVAGSTNATRQAGDSGFTMVNGMYVPNWSSEDFQWTANDKYNADPNNKGWDWVQDENGNMVQRDNGTGSKGSWGLTDAATKRLVAGGWDPANKNNVGWNSWTQGGELGAGAGGMNLAGWNDPNVNPYTGIKTGNYKNSNSTALRYSYAPDANGIMVPTATDGMNWGTNSGEINRQALAAFALIGGAGLAIPAIAGAGAAAGGAAAAGAETGATAGGLAELGSGAVAPTVAADTGLVDAGTLAGGAGGAGGGAGAAAANPYALGAEELGAGMATPGSVAPVAGEGGAATAGIPGSTAANIGSMTQQASTLSQIQNYVKQGMSVMEAIQKVTGGGTGTGTSPAGGSGSNGLLGLLGGYYSAQQQKDLSGLLKAPMSRYEGLQDPYNMLLKASYDNPNTFYDSSQWKGLESVYQNSIDRNAAKGGTLANPTDRERLLQAYGMKELENYRNGLRGDVNAYDPSKFQDMYKEGAKTEVGANTGMWAQAGRTNPTQVISDITSGVKSAKDIWDLVSGWFS